MLSGVFYGYAYLVEGIVNEYRKIAGRGSIAIATGGNLEIIRPYLRRIDIFDPMLTLKGVEKAYYIEIKGKNA